MPTPDTETLAARLRAVERALTDGSTTLDPPGSDSGGRPGAEGDPDASRAGAPRTDGAGPEGAGPDVEQRLCRLEAAVQSLRAALSTESERSDATGRGEESVAAPEPVSASAATRRPGADEPSPDRDGTGWPDDLGGEP